MIGLLERMISNRELEELRDEARYESGNRAKEITIIVNNNSDYGTNTSSNTGGMSQRQYYNKYLG